MTRIEEIADVLFSIGIVAFGTALLIGSIGIYLGEVTSFIAESDWAKMFILLFGIGFSLVMYGLAISICDWNISYYLEMIADGLKRKVKK